MNSKQFNPTNPLDRATLALLESTPPQAEIEAAAETVRRRLGLAGQPSALAGDEVIHDCAGFAAMISAYRAGTLAPPRRELFEDHTRTCVECRKALWQANSGRSEAVRPAFVRSSAWQRLAAAAVVVAGCAVAIKLGVLDRVLTSPTKAQVVAERVDGTLFRVRDGQLYPVAPDATLAASEVLRTGRGTRAVLRLADGSRVEVNEHAELAVEPRRDGTAIALHRGSVIIEAAKQSEGRHLFVDAPDCQVAVKGTVFAVTSGPKGSRVSVLEGEVWVEQGTTVTKLAPGGQTVTGTNLTPIPVAEEVAWSSDPQRYAIFLCELSEVSKQMMASLANVPLRYDSKLVPLLSPGTFIVAAVPNVSREIADAGEDLEQRIQANPQLRSFFDQQRTQNPDAPNFMELLDRFRELGSFCGDEFVIGVGGAAGEGHPSVVLLAETGNEAGLAAAIRSDLQLLTSQSGKEIPVVVADDPAKISALPGKGLIVLVAGGRIVASDSPAEVARIAALAGEQTAGFTATPFYGQIARCYRDGVTWLFAADAEQLTSRSGAATAGASTEGIAEDLGFKDVQYVLFEHKRISSQSQLRGVITFSRDRRGVPAWLGAPAPMGALEFVSPGAYAVGCILAKEPTQIADEILAAIRKHDPEGFGKLVSFESEQGLSLRDDLAAPLGGEFLVAIDGPILPKPAWKVVVLVEDPARLQHAIEKIVVSTNTRLAAEGKPPLTLDSTGEGRVTFFTLASTDGVLDLHYTFRDGYWLIAGDRVILKEALRTRASGISLPATAEFRNALPADGQSQYSALGFVNARSLGGAIASAMPNSTAQDGNPTLGEVRKMLAESSAMAFCVTAERDRILVTGTGLDILNPSGMLSMLSTLQPRAFPPPTHEQEPGSSTDQDVI